ncbi:MAG: AMP-binding protein, partial [bacterium]|nr:AMP-binding protein [bacterium]
IGALSVPLFSGFGPEAIAMRADDAGARVLLTADGFLRRGRRVMTHEVATLAAKQSNSIERVIVWRRFSEDGGPSDVGDLDWDNAFPTLSAPLQSEALDPEHPLLLAYTSGTTGRPKGCVHVHGGFLVKIMEEAAYQTDLRPDDVLYWVTDLGWLMGIWEIIGALGLGATVVMYEGALDYPDPARLLRIVSAHRVSVLGLSPTLVRSLQSSGVGDHRKIDLSNLRILGSTGEPWDDRSYSWFFETIGGERCPIINFSGGTEVGACLVSPHPVTPLKSCTVGGPSLGMDVAILAEDGSSVGPGEVGELVCRKPWPSMTRGLWGDPERYIETYWSRWPDVWVHGDWASVDEAGFWFIHGRSDDTINVAGKRLGPAEVESVLSNHPAVVSSAAVGVPDEVKGEALWCFVVHRSDGVDEEVLDEELAAMVAERLGKPFRPQRVLFVSDLPRTRSGKIVRRAVCAAAIRKDPGDLSSVENPEILVEIAAAVF